jgi:hypothetical protein
MRRTLAALIACSGALVLLGLTGCSPSPASKPVVGDPAVIADDFTKVATSAADFISTLRDKGAAVREEGKVNRLLAEVLRKREPYDRLVLASAKELPGSVGMKSRVPADAKDRADKAAERFDRELVRFQTFLGTKQTGK